ncbi:MAG TPA: phosphoheptose isomerase [Burkholderiales bacterium]|nr:phosphoheptose isomerase [Burkholderiales bacterium]
MDLIQRITSNFAESANLKLEVMDQLAAPIASASERMLQCLMEDGKILSCGNVGSAADAQHFAAELVNRFEMERPGLAAFSLTADASTITSIANDYDYSQIFSKQVLALGRPKDLLLAISTSGNSRSVLEAVSAAHEMKMGVIALTGRSGGALSEMLWPEDIHICVASNSTARIQEVHILALHCLCDAIDCLLLGVD